MMLGRLVENCISVVIVLNFGAQCQLLIYYLKDITLGLEEKTANLNQVMKVRCNSSEIKDIKTKIDGTLLH